MSHHPKHEALLRSAPIERYRAGPLAPFLAGRAVLSIGHEADGADASGSGHDTVLAAYRLQALSDYRAALQAWFALVREGGHLAVVVPHSFLYERRDALPSPWSDDQKRLYTPASLLEEVEEALAPNTYRVVLAADDDAGYRYDREPEHFPSGRHDILLVLRKIAPPAWPLSRPPAAVSRAPSFPGLPDHVRVETVLTAATDRILVLKLDHLGDFIMGIPALERVRARFPGSHVTLVCGSWNESLARELDLFDEVVAFDAFPRNPSEERLDIPGRLEAFGSVLTADYDLAIDLRTDHDTRPFLGAVSARIKAGIGPGSSFPFLDIFLPIDESRHRETARASDLPARDFTTTAPCTATRFHIRCEGTDGPVEGALVYGPYASLDPGHYIVEPVLEFDRDRPGLLTVDVALDEEIVAHRVLSGHVPALRFDNAKRGSRFEFRLWRTDDEPVPPFRFFGCRLVKYGPGDVLHQSEYLMLLVELVSIRASEFGLLVDARGAP